MLRFFSLLILMLVTSVVYSAPKVAVSIAPVHSLVSMVMRGVGEPQLLINSGQSVHQVALSPSSVRLLTKAQLIVWVGPMLESALQKPIKLVSNDVKVITLLDSPKINRLPARSQYNWAAETDHQPDEHADDDWHDPHIWLSTQNAMMIISLVRDALVELDAMNADIYRNNAEQAQLEISAIKDEINQSLQNVKLENYIVYHDAYQYFEQEFRLNPLAAITLHPDQKPGIKTLSGVAAKIQSKQVKCLFFEPQYRAKAIKQLGEQSLINKGELDPLGVAIPLGEKQWLSLMRAMRDSLLNCLSD